MPRLVVRRTGNSLAIPIPHKLVNEMDLSPGDELLVELERAPRLLSLAGSLRGKITAKEFTRLSNEGEELA